MFYKTYQLIIYYSRIELIHHSDFHFPFHIAIAIPLSLQIIEKP